MVLEVGELLGFVCKVCSFLIIQILRSDIVNAGLDRPVIAILRITDFWIGKLTIYLATVAFA